MTTLQKIRQRIIDRDYFLSSHAEDEILDDKLERKDIENAILRGRIEKKLAAFVAEAGSISLNLAYLAGDITIPSVSSDLIGLAIKKFGGVDILVNNAGVFAPKPFLDHTKEDIDAYLNLMKAYFITTQHAVKAMLVRGSGAVINIGSMWAYHALALPPQKEGAFVDPKSGHRFCTEQDKGELHCTCGGGNAFV